MTSKETADEDGVLGGDAAQVPVFQVFLEDVAAAQERKQFGQRTV